MTQFRCFSCRSLFGISQINSQEDLYFCPSCYEIFLENLKPKKKDVTKGKKR